MGKYYKYQKPGRTMFWTLILSFFIKFPGLDYSIIESIIRASMGEFIPGFYVPIPILLAIYIFTLSFKKKHPRSVTIFGNSAMLIMIGYYMSTMCVSITEVIGNAVVDFDIILDGFDTNNEAIISMTINGIFATFWWLASFRIIKRTRKAFADCDPEEDSVIIGLWAAIIVIHVIAAIMSIPAFFGNIPQFFSTNAFISMIGLLKYIFPAIFLIKLLFSARKTMKEFRLKKRRGNLGMKEALVLVIFLFSLFPVFGFFIDNGENTRPNSVYNTTWTGNSEFREMVEDKGFDVYTVQSSLSAMLTLNKSICLVIFGPTQFYNPLSEIPFFLSLLNTDEMDISFLICDDHGSTTSLLLEMTLIASAEENPLPPALFPDGVLMDNYSCYESAGEKDPSFPIITNITNPTHPVMDGVDSVILSRASALLDANPEFALNGLDELGDNSSLQMGSLVELFGWDVLARSTPYYSYLDVDQNGMYNPEKDFWGIDQELNVSLTQILSQLNIGGTSGGTLTINPKIELAGGELGLPVFATHELSSSSRIFVGSDASMFNNELIYEEDNFQMAENIVDWLTENSEDMVFVFDESHNTPRGTREFSSAAMFGLIQGYINWLSTNPFLAWIYPVWALRTLSRYIPKEKSKKKKKKKEIKETEEVYDELKFRTSSFFAQKINWYRVNKKYNQALGLLSRRVDRKINVIMENIPPSVENIIAKIQQDRGKYINKETLRRLEMFLYTMDEIKNNKREIEDIDEFNDIFFEMNWFVENF